ncbi:MAG TPA: (Fe-S)-binding protein [Terriglobales bacterium]|nr:(Fe-S)-binding protein [Terriglobales bacterium]
MATRIALFIPCFVDQITPQVGLDTARVLERVGCSVYFPSEQTCCGQPAFNTGHWDDARPLAERFVRVFADAETVVCPSGSCTAMVRNFYPELLASSPLRQDAIELGRRVFELSEFLVKVANVTDVEASFPHRVTFHDSCHALRELGIRNEPRELLKNVRGLELVEMPASEECCGFGGMFAVKFGAISASMGDSKAENVAATGAEYVASIDGSCLMHIEGVLRRRKDAARTIHLASVLAQEIQ